MRTSSAFSMTKHRAFFWLVAAAIAACVVAACPAAEVSAASAARTTDNVRLRSEPSVGSTALALVTEGSEVGVLGESGNWTKVEHAGMVGYIRSDFLVKLLGEPSGGGGALKQGSEGDAVKDLQSLLKARGFYDGPVNGKFGPLTEASVKKFQEAYGLDADGIVGAATRKKLNEKTETPKNAEQKAAEQKAAEQKAAEQKAAEQKAAEQKAAEAKAAEKKAAEQKAAEQKAAEAKAAAPGGGAQDSYRRDDEGEEVAKIQTLLTEKGFYKGPVNGKFGPMTEKAVIKFQVANKLEADGIVGKETLLALNKPANASSSSSSSSDSGGGKWRGGEIELLNWSEAQKHMIIGVTAAIYDVRTGVTYNVKSFSNGLHADVEPVTREDTALLKQTYGGVWSWDPRPVWVAINGRVMVASINGMPHGSGVNASNGMDGQVCLHFRGGSTHNSNKKYAQLHQEAVNEAWEAARKR